MIRVMINKFGIVPRKKYTTKATIKNFGIGPRSEFGQYTIRISIGYQYLA